MAAQGQGLTETRWRLAPDTSEGRSARRHPVGMNPGRRKPIGPKNMVMLRWLTAARKHQGRPDLPGIRGRRQHSIDLEVSLLVWVLQRGRNVVPEGGSQIGSGGDDPAEPGHGG